MAAGLLPAASPPAFDNPGKLQARMAGGRESLEVSKEFLGKGSEPLARVGEVARPEEPFRGRV